jgi:hypothetical protein
MKNSNVFDLMNKLVTYDQNIDITSGVPIYTRNCAITDFISIDHETFEQFKIQLNPIGFTFALYDKERHFIPKSDSQNRFPSFVQNACFIRISKKFPESRFSLSWGNHGVYR